MGATALARSAAPRLPTNYVRAKEAVARCESVDECGEWADKAQALASYGRQANDKTLVEMATRIRARAIRRLGELLRRVPAGKTGPKSSPPRGEQFGRAVAARSAGLSKKQVEHGSKLARMAAEEFERRVEASPPPTVKQLATAAKAAVAHADPFFPKATAALGTLRDFATFCRKHDAERVARVVMEHEIAEAEQAIGTIEVWLKAFAAKLGR